MEVKINKEIREYSENMFFGLTLRQFFFSALGCAAAVGIYFLCRDAMGLEITTWLCVLGVIPFAAAGFLRDIGLRNDGGKYRIKTGQSFEKGTQKNKEKAKEG